ncbi:hypothetical protein BU23DRAFT_322785 [Bimuria novae-zelandiae CBS 107.79]|uniref:Uncharacterized protein n=1 Tax=Bimuria novae-zelandiae CBS 107.79 TaxID=1447943 RepID=A0A6A5VQN0_9PLEO|nr:hypothetical protein BU23DRAFT_322785 [Bimuria novae-zelandiae CBS 107.79]
MYLFKIHLLLASLFLLFTSTSATALPSTQVPDGDFCATAYGERVQQGVIIYSNTCGSVSPDRDVTVYRAVNVDCLTCWFYEGEKCTGNIRLYGRIAPRQEIAFLPARSYLCRK